MNDSIPRIVAIGDLTADLIVAVPELPITADGFQIAEAIHLEPGGSANLLILLTRLGAAAFALGSLGGDLWGDSVFRILTEEGVEVSRTGRQGSATVALVLVDKEGHHSFVGSFGQGEPMMLGRIEKGMVAEADALFASGYSLSESRLRDLTVDALEYAGGRGIPRFFDPGPAFGSLQAEVQKRALAAIDVLLLTEEELRDLAPHGVKTLMRQNPSPGYPAGTDTPEHSGPHSVVVKRGPLGCRLYHGQSEAVDVPGLPVSVRDTTAAGDCFDAGYLLAHVKGWPPLDCARLANCAGAAAVQKLGGGRNVPTVEELRRMISQMDGEIEI